MMQDRSVIALHPAADLVHGETIAVEAAHDVCANADNLLVAATAKHFRHGDAVLLANFLGITANAGRHAATPRS
jgi:hypothetical protein